jgi:hypothetical protein
MIDMKGMTELIGILLCIQGVGALVTKIVDGGRSWFLVRHVVPDGMQVVASVVVILLGVILLWRSRDRQRA